MDNSSSGGSNPFSTRNLATWDSGRVSGKVAASVLERLYPIENFAKWFYLGLAVLIAFFATSVAATSAPSGQGWWNAAGNFLLAAGVSFVVAIAAAAVGCLLGFLFGIPRSLQRGPQILSIQTATQPDAPMAGATIRGPHPMLRRTRQPNRRRAETHHS
jgi:hypothetical protein